MVRKTRKAKIIANLRRELKKAETGKGAKRTVKKKAKKDRLRASLQTNKPVTSNLSSYVIGDLKKTLALSILAFSLIFVLYWVLEAR